MKREKIVIQAEFTPSRDAMIQAQAQGFCKPKVEPSKKAYNRKRDRKVTSDE